MVRVALPCEQPVHRIIGAAARGLTQIALFNRLSPDDLLDELAVVEGPPPVPQGPTVEVPTSVVHVDRRAIAYASLVAVSVPTWMERSVNLVDVPFEPEMRVDECLGQISSETLEEVP